MRPGLQNYEKISSLEGGVPEASGGERSPEPQSLYARRSSRPRHAAPRHAPRRPHRRPRLTPPPHRRPPLAAVEEVPPDPQAAASRRCAVGVQQPDDVRHAVEIGRAQETSRHRSAVCEQPYRRLVGPDHIATINTPSGTMADTVAAGGHTPIISATVSTAVRKNYEPRPGKLPCS